MISAAWVLTTILLSTVKLIREKTGEELDTLGIAGETILMDLPACGAGDILRGPVRNHRK